MILPQEPVLEKELTKTKSIRAKGKEIPSKKKHRRAREIPRVIPKEKEESPHSQTKRKGFKKRGIHWQDRGREYRQRWKEKHGKKWFERKKATATRMAAKQRRAKCDLH